MTNVPKISVVCTGIRVKSWKKFYENLSESEIEFELIMAGNVKPDFKLPSNFHFINTNVKPAQCVEIGVRKASSDLIVFLADDMRCDSNFLDKMYESYKINCNESDALGCLFMKFNKLWDDEQYKFWPNIKNSPPMPMGLMLNKALFNKIGGLDKRFIAIYWDLDILLRIMENGGNYYVCKSAICEEVFPLFDSLFLKYRSYIHLFGGKINKYLFNKVLFPSLWRTYGEIDRATLDSFWVKEMSPHELSDYEYYAIKDNMLHLKHRLKKISRYTEKNIVKTSQGESGRWD